MRQQRVNSRKLLVLLLVLTALLSLQCIFLVGAPAYAEEVPAFSFLIDDYYAFKNPTKIAVNGDNFAVFDGGKIVLCKSGEFISFDSSEDNCYALAIAGNHIFLLSGNDDVKHISCFNFEGIRANLVLPYANVTDIVGDGDYLYIAYNINHVAKYDSTDGTSENIELATVGECALYIGVQDDVLYLQTIQGNVLKHTAEGNVAVESISGLIGNKNSIRIGKDGAVYLLKNDNSINDNSIVYKNGFDTKILTLGTGDSMPNVITDIALENGKMYVLDGNQKAVKIFDEDGTFVKMIGTKGSALGRLNAPKSLALTDTTTIYDKENNRVCTFKNGKASALSGYTFSDFRSLAVSGNLTYVIDGDYLCAFMDNVFQNKFKMEGAKSLCVMKNGDVVVAVGKDLYITANNKGESKVINLSSQIEQVKVSLGGKVMYVKSANELQAYASSGEIIKGCKIALNNKFVDFAVDYCGNVFVLQNNGKVVRYLRTLEGFEEPTEITIGAPFEKFTSISINSNGVVGFTADDNVIYYDKTAFGVVNTHDTTFTDNVPVDASLKVCKVTADTAIAYISPDNYEDILFFDKGTKILIYAQVDYNGTPFYRVETETNTAYIMASDVQVYESGVASVANVRCLHTSVGVNIYRYPSYLEIKNKTAGSVIFAHLNKQEIISVNKIVAVEDGADMWGFYEVTYHDTLGYVLITDVVTIDEEPMPITRYSAKIKAERLGKMVALYSDASEQSEEVARLSDGKDIYMLEPLDKNREFTKVLYGGKLCYIKSQYLSEGGLTSGQILAIVLSCVAFVGTLSLVLILRVGKRRRQN